MQVSLKTVLLLTALAAIFIAWVRVSQETATTERKLLRNANRGNAKLSIPEPHSPPSVLTLDATGAVTQARLSGPNGYAELDRRPNASSQIRSISLVSMESISLFQEREFGNLDWLSVGDGFDIDFTKLSFAWLKPSNRLSGLNITAFATDPRPALNTFPDMQPLMLVLRTYETQLSEGFPSINSVSRLVLQVPERVNLEPVRGIVQRKMHESKL
jgi:hypothetical protein